MGGFEAVVILFVVVAVLYLVLRNRKSQPVRRQSLENDERILFRCAVKGESSYQDNIRRVTLGKNVDLVPEPNNQYDKNAVRIDVDGLTIGYIPREQAKEAKENEWKAIIAAINSGSKATGIVLGITETYRDKPDARPRKRKAKPAVQKRVRTTRRESAGDR